MTREDIYTSVYALMATVTWVRADTTTHSFVTMSRRVKLFADVVSAQQPSCFQAEHDEDFQQKTNLPYKAMYPVSWIIFQDTSRDTSISGAIENNLILDAVERTLAPLPSDPGFRDNRNTLGGKVYHLYIGGKVFKDPGDIDGQAMLVVPIKILVP